MRPVGWNCTVRGRRHIRYRLDANEQSKRSRMPGSSTSVFSEPDEFEAALRRKADVDLLVTAGRDSSVADSPRSRCTGYIWRSATR